MATGTVIDGVYTLAERVGEGGMAEVYRAEVDLARFDYTSLYAYTQVQGATHAERSRKAEAFALDLRGKTIDRDTVRAILEAHHIPLPGQVVAIKLSKGDIQQARFESEWKLLLCLDHPNVIQVYGGGTLGENAYYAMEFLQNIVSPERVVKEFPLKDKLALFIQAGEGLAYLHEHGIVHRDIKPDNMVTCECSEGGYRTKISDLGIAKNLDQGMGLTMTDTIMGTPYYMSPEQIASAKNVDHRADIYSLGASLYRLMTGLPPYHNKTSVYEIMSAVVSGEMPIPPKRHQPVLPDTIAAIIQCSMNRDLSRRYSDIRQMVKDLTTYLEQEADNLLTATAMESLDGEASTAMQQSGIYEFERITRQSIQAGVDLEAETQHVPPGAPVAPNQPSATDPAQTNASPPPSKAVSPLSAGLMVAVALLVGFGYSQGWFRSLDSVRRDLRPQPSPGPTNPDTDQEKRAAYERAFAGARHLMASGVPGDLDKALAQIAEAKKFATGDTEVSAVTLLAENIRQKIAEREAAKAYAQHIAEGMEASDQKRYQDAVKCFELAAEVRDTQEVRNLLLIARKHRDLQNDHTRLMAKAESLIKEKKWEEGAAAYSSALKVEGYGASEAGLAGLAKARQGQYEACMAASRAHFAEQEWAKAAAEFENALKVTGFEKDKQATMSLQIARRRQMEAEYRREYEARMAAAKRLMEEQRYGAASTAYGQAKEVEGYSADEAADEGQWEAQQGMKE